MGHARADIEFRHHQQQCHQARARRRGRPRPPQAKRRAGLPHDYQADGVQPEARRIERCEGGLVVERLQRPQGLQKIAQWRHQARGAQRHGEGDVRCVGLEGSDEPRLVGPLVAPEANGEQQRGRRGTGDLESL